MGIEVKVAQGKAIVAKVLDEGSAAHAGIVSGDQIVAINDMQIEGFSTHKIMQHLLGKSDTKAKLSNN